METRAILTHEEFVRIATVPESDGWLTGLPLLNRPELDAIEGWRDWNSSANRRLTEAQRSLHALNSAINYAHSSGGIVDWFEKDISCWNEIVRLISNIGWREFSDRFERALFGQGTGRTPDEAMKAWNKRRNREHEQMLESARKVLRRRSGKDIKADEIDLCNYAMIFAEQGEMNIPDRISPAAEEFWEWIRRGSAKKESALRVGTWLIANEEGLRRGP